MAAGLRSAAKWQRCTFSRRALHLGFRDSSNRLAGGKLALDSFSVVGRMMDNKSGGATRNRCQREKAGSSAHVQRLQLQTETVSLQDSVEARGGGGIQMKRF